MEPQDDPSRISPKGNSQQFKREMDAEIIKFLRQTFQKEADEEEKAFQKQENPICVDALFLGPHGENAKKFQELVEEVLNDHLFWRRGFHPEDPFRITEKVKRSDEYLEVYDRLQKHLRLMLAQLKSYSNPLFSFRYQAHMYWEMTIPSLVGYIATMMYNPNNVAFEGSPVTMCLEEHAAKDLCEMIEYPTKKLDKTELTSEKIFSWGHLTNGGTIANIEALWAARNLKFFPFSIRQALEKEEKLKAIKNQVKIKWFDGKDYMLTTLSLWQLLNIESDEALKLPETIFNLLNPGTMPFSELYELVSKYSVQEMGLLEVYNILNREAEVGSEIKNPVVLVTGTRHYSFPKAVSLLGLGTQNLIDIPVDNDARMDISKLRFTLKECMGARRPVIAVAGIIGSTEEGAVDPLSEILKLRDELRKDGFDFFVHADAAWGGYFASFLRARDTRPLVPVEKPSDYVMDQLNKLKSADSVTLDPHKSGYMPYPAGALCYRNENTKNIINFTAPYLSTEKGDKEPVLGIYGVEGSKPGASAAMVYLTHRVISRDEMGYGVLLGQALHSTRIFHEALLGMNEEKENKNKFLVVPLPQASTEPDLNILAYAFNFYKDGKLNEDLQAANEFNKNIYTYLRPQLHKPASQLNLVVSNTALEKSKYGEAFLTNYLKRLLGREITPLSNHSSVTVLRSVIMNPWLTEVEGGDSFVKILIQELNSIVNSVLKGMEGQKESKL